MPRLPRLGPFTNVIASPRFGEGTGEGLFARGHTQWISSMTTPLLAHTIPEIRAAVGMARTSGKR
ncbi:MAG: hypothetical protein ACJ8F7_08525, partial [Gemmataceae bacterium]